MCIYCIDEKFWFYSGCKIEYICRINLCPQICCSSYLMFSRIWWLKVLHSFMALFLRPHGKSTLALTSYLHSVRLTLKNLPKCCPYLCIFHKSCVYRTFVLSSLHAPVPLSFILPWYYYCLTKNINLILHIM